MENYRGAGTIRSMKRFFIFLLVLGFHSSLFAGDPPGNRYEQSLLETIKEIQSLDHEQALNSTRDLIKQYPHSRLGQLLYADLLLAKAEPLTEIGSGIETDRAMQDFRYEHCTYRSRSEMVPDNNHGACRYVWNSWP